MASHIVSLLFAFFLCFVSADGTSLQNNHARELGPLFLNNTKAKAVSLATNSYTGKTNYNDVLGLITLCASYIWLAEDNSDPCFPPKWRWIECNSDPRPRIIALDLSNKLLFGTLPDFSSMDALQTIDLSINSLSGPIPSFLGRFPDLQELNLAYNLFSGPVPDSLACNNLKLSITGNPNLYEPNSCSTPSSSTPSSPSNRNTGSSFRSSSAERSRKKKSMLPVILGCTISVFVVFWIAVAIFAIFHHKAKTTAAVAEASKTGNSNPSVPIEEMPMNARADSTNP